MNILVLNGSPRPQGDTAKMISVFQEAARSAGHSVTVINVCRRNIHGCLACEYCHGIGQGSCVQKDDMQEIYGLLPTTDMLVLASPIYYHNIKLICSRAHIVKDLPGCHDPYRHCILTFYH